MTYHTPYVVAFVYSTNMLIYIDDRSNDTFQGQMPRSGGSGLSGAASVPGCMTPKLILDL